MPRTAIPSERLARNLRNVRTAHHDGNAHGADRIGDAVRLGDHSGHCADADKADSPLLDESDKFRVREWLCVAIDQDDFVLRRRERLQQKHPQMRHEVLGDAIIGIIQKDFHLCVPAPPIRLLRRLLRQVVPNVR